MAFSEEWETLYKNGRDMVKWPWGDVISLTKHYTKLGPDSNVLELGVGSGANIPFFLSEDVNFYGIDGSATIAENLRKRFEQPKIHIECGDFTSEIPFDVKFDMIFDRASVTCNSTEDIKKTVELIKDALKDGGIFIGVEWFSINSEIFKDGEYEIIDDHTRVYHSGYFAEKGRKHFADLDHIKELFGDGWEFLYACEKKRVDHILQPGHNEGFDASWNFVCRKM